MQPSRSHICCDLCDLGESELLVGKESPHVHSTRRKLNIKCHYPGTLKRRIGFYLVKNEQFRKLDFSVTIQAHYNSSRPFLSMATAPHEEPCPVWLLRIGTPDTAPPSAFVLLATQAIIYDKCWHLEYALQKHHSAVVTQSDYGHDMKSTKQGTCYWLLIKAAIEHERPVEVFRAMEPWLGRHHIQFAKTHLTMATQTQELLTFVLQQSYCPTITSPVLLDAYGKGGISTLQLFGQFGTSPLSSWDSSLLRMIVDKGDVTGVRYFLAKVVELVAKRRRKHPRPTFLRQLGMPMITYVVNSSKPHFEMEIVAALREYGEPWDEGTTREAATGANMEMLNYLHEYGCAWNESVTTIAAYNGDVDMLKYALARNCPSHWLGCLGIMDTYDYVANERKIKCRDLVIKSGCFISPITVIGMAFLNDEEGFNVVRGHASLLGRIRPAFVEDVRHTFHRDTFYGHRFLWLDATQRLIKQEYTENSYPRQTYEFDLKRVVDALTSKCDVDLPYPELQLRALWLLNIPLRAVSDSSKKAYARWTIRASIRAYVTMWSVGFYLLGKLEEKRNAPGSALHLKAVGDWEDLWSADADGVVLC